MKKLFIYACFGFALFKGWEKLSAPDYVEPLLEEPYVAVYGRGTCGFTSQMISNLKGSDINYKYFVVDESDVADVLHSRMEKLGVSTRRYLLPVVDVNGKLFVRPSFNEVIDEYN